MTSKQMWIICMMMKDPGEGMEVVESPLIFMHPMLVLRLWFSRRMSQVCDKMAAASLIYLSIPAQLYTYYCLLDSLVLDSSFLFSSSSHHTRLLIPSISFHFNLRIHELVLIIISARPRCLITTTRRKCFLSCWRLFESPSDKVIPKWYTLFRNSIPLTFHERSTYSNPRSCFTCPNWEFS